MHFYGSSTSKANFESVSGSVSVGDALKLFPLLNALQLDEKTVAAAHLELREPRPPFGTL